MIAVARGLFVDSRLMQRVNLGARRARLTLGLCRECPRPRAPGSRNFCGCHRAKHAAASTAWCKRHPEHHARVAAWRAQRRGAS